MSRSGSHDGRAPTSASKRFMNNTPLSAYNRDEASIVMMDLLALGTSVLNC